jgi:hypothetical protein
MNHWDFKTLKFAGRVIATGLKINQEWAGTKNFRVSDFFKDATLFEFAQEGEKSYQFLT